MRLTALMLACALSGPAAAADIKVLSSVAMAPALTKVAEQYRKDTKNRARIQYLNAAQLERRVDAGESADVLVAAPGLMGDQLRRNKVDAEKHVFLGRVGVGVVVRAGGFDPDVGTLDHFKQALLSADAIVYAQPGPGVYLEKLFELLGMDQVKAKIVRYAGSPQVLEHIAAGKGMEIGFATIPEIRQTDNPGLKFVGPLPEQVQFTTTYSAGVMSGAADADLAWEFVQYLGTPPAKAIFSAAGYD